jgi:hypothetical protein
MTIYQGEFGSCCKDLSDGMEQPPQSFLRVEDNWPALEILIQRI